MHTASDPRLSSGSTPVYDLNRVRAPGVSPAPDLNLGESDRDTSALLAQQRKARGSRFRRIAVRVLAYLAIAAMLFLFGRMMTDNAPMRRAVLDFVTFGHSQVAHTGGQWLAAHGVQFRR